MYEYLYIYCLIFFKNIYRYNAVIFDNSISIHTSTGEIFLTSFVYRDKAFNIMEQVLSIYFDESIFSESESE